MHFSTPIVIAAAAQVASAAQGTVLISDSSDFSVQTFGYSGANAKVSGSFWDTISKTANTTLSVPVDGYSVTSAFKDQKLDGWKLNLYVQDNIPAGSGIVAGAAIQLVSPDSQKTDAMGDWDICAYVFRTPNSKGAATDKGSCSALASNDCVQNRLKAFLADPKCGSFATTDDGKCLPMTKDTVGTYQHFGNQDELKNKNSSSTWLQYLETADSTHKAGDSTDYNSILGDAYVVALKWTEAFQSNDVTTASSSYDPYAQPTQASAPDSTASPALGQVVCLAPQKSSKTSNGGSTSTGSGSGSSSSSGSSDSKSGKSGAAGVVVNAGLGLAALLGTAVFVL